MMNYSLRPGTILRLNQHQNVFQDECWICLPPECIVTILAGAHDDRRWWFAFSSGVGFYLIPCGSGEPDFTVLA